MDKYNYCLFDNKNDETYPSFNELMPPQQENLLKLLPSRSEYGVIHTSIINKQNFDDVYDTKYPWQTMPNYDNKQYEQREQTKKDKLNYVSHYELDRIKYWSRYDYFPIPEGSSNTKSTYIRYGYENTHFEQESLTISESIGVNLGLNFSNNLFGTVVKSNSNTALNNTQYLNKIFDVGGNVEFTYNISKDLYFSTDDQYTYSREVEISETSTYETQYFYFLWQLCEGLALYRITNINGNEQRELVSITSTKTHIKSCQSVKFTNSSLNLIPSLNKLNTLKYNLCASTTIINTQDSANILTTGQFELKPGENVVYCTKPAGMGDTELYVKGSDLGDGRLESKAILCCHPTEIINIPKGIPQFIYKLSGTGALNKITNVGSVSLVLWTNI